MCKFNIDTQSAAHGNVLSGGGQKKTHDLKTGVGNATNSFE